MSKLPLLIILGSTGTGKTKLSIELAKKFGGEIISADSMQIYKGLDIITAKVSKPEQKLVPHHMIDILEPNETYTVLEYRNRALPIIENLLGENKLPIVAGGTNYYIESLLWKVLVNDTDSEVESKPYDYDYDLPSEELHEKLRSLDPKMAARLHPNNKRKILRSLEVLHQKGKRLSDILDEQRKSEGGSSSGGPLRFPNSLILWIRCEKSILDERLNKRVDDMINEGLLEELRNFRNRVESTDFTKGVLQSIGFKEFHPYFSANEQTPKIFEQCTDRLKLVTRRYAKKQTKWIVNRFLGRTDREVPPVYALEGTDPERWDTEVLQRATTVVESFVRGEECPYEKLSRVSIDSKPNSSDESRRCEVCERVFVGDFQWSIHLKSNRHKRGVERKFKRQKIT